MNIITYCDLSAVKMSWEVTVADVGEARHTFSRISIRLSLYLLNKYIMFIKESHTDGILQTHMSNSNMDTSQSEGKKSQETREIQFGTELV